MKLWRGWYNEQLLIKMKKGMILRFETYTKDFTTKEMYSIQHMKRNRCIYIYM